MNLSFLINILNKNKEFKLLLQTLQEAEGSHSISVRSSAKPLIISSICQQLKLPVLIITPQKEKAVKLLHNISDWERDDIAVLHFPKQPDIGDMNTYPENAATGLQVLSHLSQYKAASGGSFKNTLIITSLTAAMERIIPPEKFKNSSILISVGMIFEKEKYLETLHNFGFKLENRVEVPGTFSQRGGIIDIFPMTSASPVRLELAGNRVDTLRLFDPKTQGSLAKIETYEFSKLTSLSDLQSHNTILDYLQSDTLLIFDDCESIFSNEDDMDQIDAVSAENTPQNSGYPKENIHLINYADLQIKMDKFKQRLCLNSWNAEKPEKTYDFIFPFSAIPPYGGRLENFINDLKRNLAAGLRNIIVSQQNERIIELLAEKDIHTHQISGSEYLLNKGTVYIVKGSLEQGWTFENTYALFTDYEIFGWVKQERSVSKRPVRHHLYLNQLREGSYVVHVDHGIGRFTGFIQMENEGIQNQYIVLEYAAGDKLYVPAHQLERISPYIGGGEKLPSLSRLHTQEWDLTKIRIKKSVIDIARDLLQLYAIRETTAGFAYSPDSIWQRELESSFPYMETPDQLKAVNDVKQDMEIEKPMDRLICGDVGYGKTEIALRAAFKAVMDNRQVAILVPTTVLAQQHYYTFYDRLQAFPVRLEVLSRFTSEKEQRAIVQGLASGSIDICIGTHRLLQKDISFKNLGLLIIDEEQRFGVSHKEFFKKLRGEIDVLTLSATPIPRTLHMSLAGIKDLSTLETPPEDRLPIKTFLGLYNRQVVRNSILNEIKRHGQVYYVHNRVCNIDTIALELKLLVPEAEILVAHGQMPEEELAKVMADFIKHKADVLLTTTIIESGIDIPTANTLIIDASDRLGLTQLYQLRGRIGRGANNAFAYFFYRNTKDLTEQARKRLETIAEATELGAGYAIAMKDLEIRGAGNLLGTEQSGYISAVGFDLYCRLLAETVEELRRDRDHLPGKSKTADNSFETTISLPLPAYVPEEYMPDTNDRIEFYRSLAMAMTDSDIKKIEEELHDRFGNLPLEVDNLIYIAKLRRKANSIGIERINARSNEITLFFAKSTDMDINSSVKHGFLRNNRNVFKFGFKQIKMDIEKAGKEWRDILILFIQNVAERFSGNPKST